VISVGYSVAKLKKLILCDVCPQANSPKELQPFYITNFILWKTERFMESDKDGYFGITEFTHWSESAIFCWQGSCFNAAMN